MRTQTLFEIALAGSGEKIKRNCALKKVVTEIFEFNSGCHCNLFSEIVYDVCYENNRQDTILNGQLWADNLPKFHVSFNAKTVNFYAAPTQRSTTPAKLSPHFVSICCN